MTNKVEQLIHLAENKLDLTSTEIKFLQAVVKGEEADFSSDESELNDPANASEWDEDRTLRASLIVWLCTDPIACQSLTYLGLNITGARIEETLDLKFASLGFPFIFRRCAFLEPIRLEQAFVKFLNLSGSHVSFKRINNRFDTPVYASIEARGTHVEGDVLLSNGFKATGCISLNGATIGGNLDCKGGVFDSPGNVALTAFNAEIKGDVELGEGFNTSKGFVLNGASLGSLQCDGGIFDNPEGCTLFVQDSEIKGSILLRNGFKTNGEVNLQGTKIGGVLSCRKGIFNNPEGCALTIENAEIKGSVLLNDNFCSKGSVTMLGAKIGSLLCDGGSFDHPQESALVAKNVEVEGAVLLRDGFNANGQVTFEESKVGGAFDCEGGVFTNSQSIALNLKNSEVKGYVSLNLGFQSIGCVWLQEAIFGSLNCEGGRFSNPYGFALMAQDIHINHSVYLSNNFKANGCVSLSGSVIGGGLICSKGTFENSQGPALLVETADIKGVVFLRDGFKANGDVILTGTTIGRVLDCQKGQFIGFQGFALIADHSVIKGPAYLCNGFRANGTVSLSGAIIGGNLECQGGIFLNPNGFSLIAQGTKIERSVYLSNSFQSFGKVHFVNAKINDVLELKKICNLSQMSLNLRYTSIRTLADQKDGWPRKDKLILEGLVYDKIDNDSPLDSQSRLQWLELQSSDDFSPQPYEQLAKVMKDSGHESAATDVLIRKQDNLRTHGKLSWWDWSWNFLLGHTIAHGYRPHQVLVFGLVVVFVGTIMFSLGSPNWGASDIMSPAQVRPFSSSLTPTTFQQEEISSNYPAFNPLIYSLDTFVPIIDLHQQKYWLPNANNEAELPLNSFMIRVSGCYLRWYLWLHITVGWIVTSLWVAGFTGLVRRIQ